MTTSHQLRTWEPIYEDIRTNPSKYQVVPLKDRVKRMSIGRQTIPNVGKVRYMDNEWLEYNPEVKKEFPELVSKRSAAIFERVKEVRTVNDKSVDVVSEVYMIQEKNDVSTLLQTLERDMGPVAD